MAIEQVKTDTRDDIFARIRGKVPIPVVPVVAAKVTREANNPNVNAGTIVRILRDDQALAGRVMAISNSALYRRAVATTSLEAAVVRIGMRNIRDIAIALSTKSLNQRFGPTEKRLWDHAVATALATSVVIKICGRRDDAFVLGLLHNLGKVILNNVSAAEFERAEAMVSAEKISDVDAETKIFSFNHAEVGAATMLEWNMHADHVDAIFWYRSIAEAAHLSTSAKFLAAVVNVSAALADNMDGDNLAEHETPLPKLVAIARGDGAKSLGLSPEQLVVVDEEVRALCDSERSIYD